MKPLPTPEKFLSSAKDRGYRVFESVPGRPFNLNIVGWRNVHGKPDEFSDYISIYYLDPQTLTWQYEGWAATTRPGIPWLLKPMNPRGTAILAPGQYLGVYRLGKFRGYDALKQVRPVRVFRDYNKDDLWDTDDLSTDRGLFGIHVHKAGVLSSYVGLWSAGCQVFKGRDDFDSFIRLCRLGEQYWGNSFSYTLLEF